MWQFIKSNWFSIGAVIFATGAYVATLQTVQARVGTMETKIEANTTANTSDDRRLDTIEQAQKDVSDDVREIRKLTESAAWNIAAVCEKTQARCK